MQAIFRKIDSIDNFSFIARMDEFQFLYNKWHFHPELELTYINKSTGTRFVGDSIESFEEGELILIGSYLPHVWKNDISYFDKNSTLTASSQVIQFLPDFLGKDFMSLREMDNINDLIERSKRGIRINGDTKKEVKRLFDKLLKSANGLNRISLLLEILELIALSEEITYLSSQTFRDTYHRLDSEKINKVFEFTLSNYSRKILLNEAVAIVNMSIPNFCKYFKQRTQKTYIQYLTEVRIGFACRMVIENKSSIQQIAYDCGFINLSNFNRSFKLLKKQKPAEYRNKYIGLK